jgi:hypothetical protein
VSSSSRLALHAAAAHEALSANRTDSRRSASHETPPPRQRAAPGPGDVLLLLRACATEAVQQPPHKRQAGQAAPVSARGGGLVKVRRVRCCWGWAAAASALHRPERHPGLNIGCRHSTSSDAAGPGCCRGLLEAQMVVGVAPRPKRPRVCGFCCSRHAATGLPVTGCLNK